ncbi:hypothetical protein B0H11DRAFT_2052465 [Mycena galericulata]|nr:hypothetical protein B0H11DRAFT_2052465 [Mycena galericulata]
MDNAASAKAMSGVPFTSDVITALRRNFCRYFQNYCHLFGVSFLIWDHILTLGDERRFVWKRKKSATSVYLFFILRYGALGTNIPVLVFSFVTLKYRPCVEYDLIHQIFMLITQLVVSTVMILRIYSLYNRSARVLGALLGIGICFLSLTIWSVTQGQHGFPITVFQGCHLAIVQSASYHLAAPWTCLFVFDTIIFGLTINNACATRRGLGRYADMPIHRLLVRDGAMYFV